VGHEPALRKKKDQTYPMGPASTGSGKRRRTDHCPFLWKQKLMGSTDFSKIPNGHPAIENRMELLFSEGVAKGRISLNKYVEVACTNPSKIFGMFPGKVAFPGQRCGHRTLRPRPENIPFPRPTHHMNVDYSA